MHCNDDDIHEDSIDDQESFRPLRESSKKGNRVAVVKGPSANRQTLSVTSEKSDAKGIQDEDGQQPLRVCQGERLDD